jgi:uncharacterized membrane protein HdeD (DUF308 family)
MAPVALGTWRTLAVRGALGVLFGALVLAIRAVKDFPMVVLFGSYALLDGLLAGLAGLLRPLRDAATWFLLEGVAGALVGVALLLSPEQAAPRLVHWIAVWALVTGAIELAVAARLREVIPSEMFLHLAGGARILLGVAILLWPNAGVPVYGALLGVCVLFFGMALLVLGFHMRRALRRHEPHAAT